MSANGGRASRSGSLSATQAEELDRACDRFEAAWRAAEHPRIEDHLAVMTEPLRSALLDQLIAVEVDWRRRNGEGPTPAEYQERFPAHAASAAAFGPAATAVKAKPPCPDLANGLLLGLLAFQNNFIDREALLAALTAWVADKAIPFGRILVVRGVIDTATHALLEALASKHLEVHGGDTEKSLAALALGGSTREVLASVGDPDIQATLSRVGAEPSPAGRDTDRTASYIVGTATSGGQRFRVLRPHAKGGLGAVFVALDSELNREVALKQILDHHADDLTSRARFLLEAEITGGLEHPGIVPVYGLGSYGDGRPFYAMRFIKGDSLKEAIERFHGDAALKADPGRRSLELRKLLRRFTDVCNAIDYAHSRGVLHRDIKPGNVIVGKHGETLVVDWGLAKALGRVEPGQESGERTLVPSSANGLAETLPGSALGTPAYMSPEQASGDLDRLGPRSDVYSLGSTLYCLLSGRSAFEGADLGEVLRKVQESEFPSPRQVDPSIDKALEAVCLKAMATKPEDRYASCRALAEDVERWAADEPVSAVHEPVSARLARWARRHRTAVSTLGLSLGMAVVLLTVSNVLVSNAQRETSRALVRVTEEQGHTAEALRRADANFRRARQAVEDYFTTVSEEVLLDEPGMQGLREKLLRSALRYHEMFLKERADDPTIEAELAESHRRYAVISMNTGQPEDPLPHLRIAQEQFERLAQRHPDRPEYRRQVASTLADLGIALWDRKPERQEAMRADRDAIAIYEQLLLEHPEDTTILDDLAKTLASLGLKCSAQRDGSEEATRHMQRARDIMQRLVAQQPESLRHRLKLAEIHNTMYINLVGDQHRQDEALQSSQNALGVYEELLSRAPHSPRFKTQLGMIHDTRGMLYARKGRFADAIREAQEARRILAELVRANPENALYRGHLAGASVRLGVALTTTGADVEALGPLRESCDAFEHVLKNRPGDMSFQIEYLTALSTLGSVLGRLGRNDESVSVLRQASERLADVCRRDPTNVFLSGTLMDSKFDLALSLTRSGGRHEEAIAAYEESLSIGKAVFGGEGWSHGGSNAAAGHISMAYSLREAGRDKEAEQAVAKARGSLANDAPSFYELARYDARGAQRLEKAGGDARAIDTLKHRALAALQQAVTLGFSEKLSVREFGELFQVHDRPEFRLILLDLAFPAKPFASGD